MPRPVNADAAATRQTLLRAATKLFAEHGLQGTSVRQIADEANLSLGLVRHYFGSKEQLYNACLEGVYEIFEQLATMVGAAIGRDESTEALLAEATRVGFQYGVSNRLAVKLLLQDLTRGGEQAQQRTERLMLPFLRIIGSQLAARLQMPVSEAVLAVRTMTLLVTRYASLEPEEIAQFLDVETADATEREQETLRLVENHLVELFLAMTAHRR